MRNKLKFVILTLLLSATTLMVQAQKIAYTNTNLILSEMPEVKRADANLETMKKQLLRKKENMVASYETKFKAAMERDKNGELSPKEVEDLKKQLADSEKAIFEYDQTVQKQLLEKRQQEVEPILKKVQNAIDQVAQENGYIYVVDTSSSVLLYAKEQYDITPLIRQKLGI